MYRGTTPTHVFDVNIDLRGATVHVSYSQNGTVLADRTNDTISITATQLAVQLTQEETLAFEAGVVEMQIRFVLPDGYAGASQVMRESVKDVLKGGVI